jgi:hypothetical protein
MIFVLCAFVFCGLQGRESEELTNISCGSKIGPEVLISSNYVRVNTSWQCQTGSGSSVTIPLFKNLQTRVPDGQIQSLITEVQNIIGQNRETQHSLKETADKVSSSHWTSVQG